MGARERVGKGMKRGAVVRVELGRNIFPGTPFSEAELAELGAFPTDPETGMRVLIDNESRVRSKSEKH